MSHFSLYYFEADSIELQTVLFMIFVCYNLLILKMTTKADQIILCVQRPPSVVTSTPKVCSLQSCKRRPKKKNDVHPLLKQATVFSHQEMMEEGKVCLAEDRTAPPVEAFLHLPVVPQAKVGVRITVIL